MKNNIVLYNWTDETVVNTQVKFIVTTHMNECGNQVAIDLFIEIDVDECNLYEAIPICQK